MIDFNKKIVFQDLKLTFTNILKIDLFSKLLQFYISKSFHSFQLSLKFKWIEFLLKKRNHLKIIVKFYEEGA
ncbi:unnamed protein product [Paramecium primaurelia]|uniref:Uncharacterized protein n=1 Tax=Paramecium primaurelia TaxID=5886 RepID=A0A8S1N1F7_PARPR|nr:unnamed protein product [Paramecium primaurelia]